MADQAEMTASTNERTIAHALFTYTDVKSGGSTMLKSIRRSLPPSAQVGVGVTQ
jgi:hypothetical protein